MYPDLSYAELVDVYGPILLEGGILVTIKHSPDCLPTKAPYDIKSSSEETISSKYLSHCSPCKPPCRPIGIYPPKCVPPCGPIYAKPQCVIPYRPPCSSPCRPIYQYPCPLPSRPICQYPCPLPSRPIYQYPCPPPCVPIYKRPQYQCRPICVNPCQPQCLQPLYPQCGYPKSSIGVRQGCLYPLRQIPCPLTYGNPCCPQLSPCDYLDDYYLD